MLALQLITCVIKDQPLDFIKLQFPNVENGGGNTCFSRLLPSKLGADV